MNATATVNIREFIEKASLASARIHRVKDMASALSFSIDLCKSKLSCDPQMEPVQIPAGVGGSAGFIFRENPRIMAAPNLDEKDFARLFQGIEKAKDILLIRENLRDYPGGIDMGITLVDFGIAETGTLVLNSNSEETRLSTMLCEIHVAILEMSKIRETALSMADELNELVRQPFSFTAFITGPSRTADIERVLALGVHGPLELVILLVEA